MAAITHKYLYTLLIAAQDRQGQHFLQTCEVRVSFLASEARHRSAGPEEDDQSRQLYIIAGCSSRESLRGVDEKLVPFYLCPLITSGQGTLQLVCKSVG